MATWIPPPKHAAAVEAGPAGFAAGAAKELTGGDERDLEL